MEMLLKNDLYIVTIKFKDNHINTNVINQININNIFICKNNSINSLM
jgi:hypothetical protein